MRAFGLVITTERKLVREAYWRDRGMRSILERSLTKANTRYEQAIRDAAGEAALALLAMDGVEFTPEQHNSVIDAILALQEKP